MTNHWVDIKNADLVLIMGGNAAEAHPCGFKWVVEAKKDRKAKLVVVDPRFTRSVRITGSSNRGAIVLVDDAVRQDLARAHIPLAAQVEGRQVVLESGPGRDGVHDLQALGDDLRSGAVARKDRDLVAHGSGCSALVILCATQK